MESVISKLIWIQDKLAKTVSRHWLFGVCLIIAIALYGFLSIGNYLRYRSFAYDLGIYVQSSWFISQWQLPLSTIRGVNQFGDHFSPVYIVLSLGYGLFQTPIYLLVLQIASVAAGSIPVYLLARALLRSLIITTMVVWVYFLQIGLLSAIRFDFHLATLSVGFISWAIYFWYKNHHQWYILLMLLAILTKIDVAVLFAFFAIYLIWLRQFRMGISTLAICIAWYFFNTHVIIPFFLHQSFGYDTVGSIGEGWDVKWNTIITTLGQNAGVATLSPIGWAFVVPNFLSRFLSPSSVRWVLNWQYGANIAAPLAIATVFGLAKLQKKSYLLSLLVGCYMMGVTIYTSWPLVTRIDQNPIDKEILDAAIASIPADVSVSAQDIFVPHLANRSQIYLFPDHYQQAEYTILAPGLPSFPINGSLLPKYINQLQQTKQYTQTTTSGVYLFHRINQ